MRYFVLGLLLISLLGCQPEDQDQLACMPKDSIDKNLFWINFAGQKFPIRAQTIGEHVFREGDIFLGTIDELISGRGQFSGHPWLHNVVNYKINPKLPLKKRVYSAIKRWEKVLGGIIEFREVVDADNFIEIVPSQGCWSFVGMRGGRQELGIDFTCTTGTVAHEFGHALGLEHEHTRSDRDQYLKVNWCNVQEAAKSNLLKDPATFPKYGAYDYRSIMHYGQFSFSKNLGQVLVSKTSTPVPLISPKFPRKKDVLSVRCIHGDNEACGQLAQSEISK